MPAPWFLRRAARPPEPSIPADPIDTAFQIALWRPPSDRERREVGRALDAGTTPAGLAARLLSSTEFALILQAVRDRQPVGRHDGTVEVELGTLGPPELFVTLCYRVLLDRDPDANGLAFYAGEVSRGQRLGVIRALLTSDEFEGRYRRLRPQIPRAPRDVQLCELANPAKWDNPDWLALLQSLQVVPSDKLSMHRKGYELTQLLFGLQELGRLRDDVEVVSVGAGHEPVLYWLANRVRRVVATDLYEGEWQQQNAMEGDAQVVEDPGLYAPFEYRQDHLTFHRMDGRALGFEPETFDVAYSLSSIEHFGGVTGARQAIDEMVRVLRPGGVLALATEYVLNGVAHHEAFQPAQVHALITHPQLRLVQPIDEHVYQRYRTDPVDLRVNRHHTPHMLVRDEEAIFTSVMVFLEKT
jgi:SAM-dependent methyltransferase